MKSKQRDNMEVSLSTSKPKVKELPEGGATLASEAGDEGFGTGADGFFSSVGNTCKYKMPKSTRSNMVNPDGWLHGLRVEEETTCRRSSRRCRL